MATVTPNQSVTRAFAVLEHLAEHPGGRLREVATACRLPPPTALRFLTNLVALGYLVHDADGSYAPSTRLAALGRSAMASNDSGHRVLARLAATTGVTASLVAEDGDEAVYLQRAVPRHGTLLATRRIGHRAPLYCTAVGKLFLAARDEAGVRAYAAAHRCLPLTPATLTTADALLREIAAIRQQGWAIDDEECERGVRCVAVPVGAIAAGLTLAVSISGPADRLSSRPSDAELSALRQAAGALSCAPAHRRRDA